MVSSSNSESRSASANRSNAQSSKSSNTNRSTSPSSVNRLTSSPKDKDLRTTVLKKQSKLAASSNVLTLGDSNEQKLYDSDDGTGDEDEEISQKVKLPKIDQFFKYARSENVHQYFYVYFFKNV